MKRNALPYLIIKTLIIVLLLTVAFLTSCGNNSSTPTGSSTATLSETTMCKLQFYFKQLNLASYFYLKDVKLL